MVAKRPSPHTKPAELYQKNIREPQVSLPLKRNTLHREPPGVVEKVLVLDEDVMQRLGIIDKQCPGAEDSLQSDHTSICGLNVNLNQTRMKGVVHVAARCL